MRGNIISDGWLFSLDEPEGAHLMACDETSWEQVRLPHDWSIERPYDAENGVGCVAYLMGGMGWYRKHLMTTEEMQDKRVILNFDGIYNRATIYVNEEKVTFHPFGYSPCLMDITDYLNPENEDNVIAVRVDRTRHADSRWYAGAGIYRNVALYLLPKVHIPVWGMYFTTPEVSEKEAVVQGEITLKNTAKHKQLVKVCARLYNAENECIQVHEQLQRLQGDMEVTAYTTFKVENPVLWEIHEGKMYRVEVTVSIDDVVLQTEELKIGLRSFVFDVDKGFFINGKHTYIKGVCLHHDGGAVGAAVPTDVWRRRLEKLIEGGCNAIRTAHNPASEEFLDLCDELGLLVQEEFYDEWDNPKGKRCNGVETPDQVEYITRGHAEFFKDYAKKDLQNTVLRDRNHPSIIQWSIGNEIEWTYPKYNNVTGYFGADAAGGYFFTLPPYSLEKIRENVSKVPKDLYEVGETARKLATWTKEMDTTRPVIANCILPSVSYETGYTDALDMVGYSYRRVIYPYGHEHYHDKPIMGTENVGQWHEWKAILENPYATGIFIWTGIDYLGEAGRFEFPRKASTSGMLDFNGQAKHAYYMFKSLWTEEPTLRMVTQTLPQSLYTLAADGALVCEEKDRWDRRLWRWHEMYAHWNYETQEPIVIELYSNCEEVTLYLNNQELGTKYLKDYEDRIYKWCLPYEAGELKAVGIKAGEVIETTLVTAGALGGISMTADKKVITTDRESAVHVEVQLLDEVGQSYTHQEAPVTFELSGPYYHRGVDNGSGHNVTPYRSLEIETFNGRCMIILQGVEPGEIKVEAVSGNIHSEVLTIQVVAE